MTSSEPSASNAPGAGAQDPSNRDTLTQRQIPHMQFSTDGPTSLTAAPSRPLRDSSTPYDARAQARQRFAVEGNVIITGGAGMLGLALARGVLEHEATGVALFDMATTLGLPATEAALTSLRSDFPHASILTMAVNVTAESDIVAALDGVWSQLGGARHLICCAGIVGVVHALDESAEHWRRVLDVNLTGSFLCAKLTARRIADAGTGGTILLTSSLGSGRTLFPQPQAAYNASKAGITSLTRSLGAEWAGAGIRVNCIAPGYMDTILNEGAGLETARQAWNSRCPMGRLGQPEELIGTAVMLCSRAGSYITGAEIHVDGGSSAL